MLVARSTASTVKSFASRCPWPNVCSLACTNLIINQNFGGIAPFNWYNLLSPGWTRTCGTWVVCQKTERFPWEKKTAARMQLSSATDTATNIWKNLFKGNKAVGNYIALFFAKVRKYALTCVNLQRNFLDWRWPPPLSPLFQNLRPKYTILKPTKSAM